MTLLKSAAEFHGSDHIVVEAEASKKNLLLKQERASETPGAHGLLRDAREHVITLDAESIHVRGYPSIFSLVQIAAAVVGAYGVSVIAPAIAESAHEGELGLDLFAGMLIFVLVGICVAAILSATRGFRLDLWAPKQIPLGFNRKTRKVYRFLQEIPEFSWSWSYFTSSFRRWPMVLVEYDWDCIDAEYWEEIAMIGTVAKTMHVLQFKVRQSPGSQILIGGFTLSSPMTAFKKASLDRWEHIRRFMEEKGPHAYGPNDLAPPFPRTLIQSAQLMGGKKTWFLFWIGLAWGLHRLITVGFWEQPLWMKLIHVLVTFMGALSVTAEIFNWLSFRFFAPDVELPAELHADAGSVLDVHALAEQAPAQSG
jgi:hypothetical protein